MRISYHNVGVALAVTAGTVLLALTMWPIVVPQARGEVGALWGIATFVMGVGFLLAAFLADTHPWFARVILLAGAAALLVAGLLFGITLARVGPFAVGFAAVPALLAGLAALLIGPMERPEERGAA